ncbi:unknown [Ruminococcus sp. CAG:382]|nr:unknown [Ruminococcus sp. CAG:382]
MSRLAGDIKSDTKDAFARDKRLTVNTDFAVESTAEAAHSIHDEIDAFLAAEGVADLLIGCEYQPQMSIVSVFGKRFHRKKRNGDPALTVDYSRTGHNITAYFHRRISELSLIVDSVHMCKEHITFGSSEIHIYHKKIAGFFKRLACHSKSER